MCSAAEDDRTRQLAFTALPKVARIGTHLFQFAGFMKKFRGWGRAARTAIGDWYLAKEADQLAYQMAKYGSRDGYSHRDLLRLSHPEVKDLSAEKQPAMRALFQWAVNGAYSDDLPDIIKCVEHLKKLPPSEGRRGLTRNASIETTTAMIKAHNVSREMLPTEMLNEPEIWNALLDRMPMTAIIRNLGKMTSNGVITDRYADVVSRIKNAEALQKARVHPLTLLTALHQYGRGHGDRGSLSWTPHGAVVQALDDAFYLSFPNHQGAGKRILVALDVSGSMGVQIAGSPLDCRQASAAMALITMATEPEHEVIGFTSAGSNYFTHEAGRSWGGRSGVAELPISPKMRLQEVVQKISGLPFGGTDCALPMIYAAERKKAFDGFVVYTDSETWAGSVHPSEALKAYRSMTGIDAKLVVVGMTSNGFSIADPNDAGMLDCVGFDVSTPQIISDFIRG